MIDYITEDEFREYIGSSTSAKTATITGSITAASRMIDSYCGRNFDDTAAVVSARLYRPTTDWYVYVDDFKTTTGLIVKLDLARNETFTTTLTLGTDFVVHPRNALRDGIDWPYSKIELTGRQTWWATTPGLGNQDIIQVTAEWGWSSIPEPIKSACKIITNVYLNLGAAPFGVAGVNGWGDLRVRDPLVDVAGGLLMNYRKGSTKFLVA